MKVFSAVRFLIGNANRLIKVIKKPKNKKKYVNQRTPLFTLMFRKIGFKSCIGLFSFYSVITK